MIILLYTKCIATKTYVSRYKTILFLTKILDKDLSNTLIKEIKKLTELHIVKTVYNVLRLSRSISKP